MQQFIVNVLTRNIHVYEIVNARILQLYITQYILNNPCIFNKSDLQISKGALAWYGKLTWESAHAWILKIICYLIVWGITLIFMVRLSFYAISLLIYKS